MWRPVITHSSLQDAGDALDGGKEVVGSSRPISTSGKVFGVVLLLPILNAAVREVLVALIGV